MITTSKNRNKPYTMRKVFRLVNDRLYYFGTTEAPKTGYYRKTDTGFVAYFTALKYSAIMAF